MLTEEKVNTFDKLLRDTNPEATSNVITLARNAFLRRYGSYAVAPEIALAIATDEELLRLPHAGKKCQQAYANAQISVRAAFVNPIQDILELKKAIYNVCSNAYDQIGVDRMVLQCVERGARSKERFDILMPMMIAERSWMWAGDVKILEHAWKHITRQQHPNVKDPHAYIVRYYDDGERYPGKSICYVGVDQMHGKKQLVDKLVDAGYNVNVSGRINGLPIHFINAEKKEEEPHGET